MVECGGKCSVPVGRNAERTHAIRSKQAAAAGVRDLDKPCLRGGSVSSHFRKSRSEYGGNLNPGICALFDGIRYGGCRYGNYCAVDNLADRGEIGKGRKPLDFGSTRVDRIKSASEPALLGEVDWSPANLIRIGRGSDDGGGGRVEQVVQES